jgi:hypothetical protein
MTQRYPEREGYGRGEERGHRRTRGRDDDMGGAQYGRSRSSRRNDLSERAEFDDEYGERAGGYGGEYGQSMSANYAGGYDNQRQQRRRDDQGGMRGQSYGDNYRDREEWDRGYRSRSDNRPDHAGWGTSANVSDRPYGSSGADRQGQSAYRGAQGQDGGGYGQAYRGGSEGYYGEPSRNYLSRGGRTQWGQHSGRGPKNYTRSDERVRDDVNDRLTEDPDLDASEIEVKVTNCEVTLSGTVDSREAKRRAEDCADSVAGVRHVQNNLRVQSGEEASRPSRKTRGDGDRA